MKPSNMQASVSMASGEFIKDVSSLLHKLRHRIDLLSKKQRNALGKYKSSLKKLTNPKTSIKKKRNILAGNVKPSKGKGQRGGQRGGILPLLIPLLVAGIGAAGGVAASATHAAIVKS